MQIHVQVRQVLPPKNVKFVMIGYILSHILSHYISFHPIVSHYMLLYPIYIPLHTIVPFCTIIDPILSD